MSKKYVIVDDGMNDYPIIFPKYVDHGTFNNLNVVSAGFFDICDGKIIAYGESVSLKKQSNSEYDSKLLQKLLQE